MLLQENYDRVIGSRVRTILENKILHLMFDHKYESSINQENPKEVIYKYNDVIQKKCNHILSKSRPNRILLAGIGGGTVLTGFNPKTATIIDCVDISPIVINHFKNTFSINQEIYEFQYQNKNPLRKPPRFYYKK